MLAGAQRVECCLFGNGERTGNVDAVTLAMNMYSHGVDPKLDFSDMPAICATYERVTRMHVYERSPYAGQLVFAAFSGSHQDAIAKGMTYRKENGEHRWTCPYIPIDPHDIGRTYDADVIRINSQSGKGGIGFVLEQNYGYNLPPKMREALGYKVKGVSDHSHKELSASEVLRIFEDSYLNHTKPLNVVAGPLRTGGRHHRHRHAGAERPAQGASPRWATAAWTPWPTPSRAPPGWTSIWRPTPSTAWTKAPPPAPPPTSALTGAMAPPPGARYRHRHHRGRHQGAGFGY